MGKCKSCTLEIRNSIFVLRKGGKSYKEIAATMFKKMVFNVLNHIQKYATVSNVARQKRSRKTSDYTDRMIRRICKTDPKKSLADIHSEIYKRFNISIPKRTILRRLVKVGLNGRAAHKRPLLSKIQQKRHVEFAKTYLNWTPNERKYVLWNNESKINRVDPDDRRI